MQQGAQVVVVVLAPDGVDGVGSFGFGAEAIQALGGKGMQRVADSLDAAAQPGSDPGRALALDAGQEDLAAAQSEGAGRAEAVTQGRLLGVGQRLNKQWCFHASLYATNDDRTACQLILH